MNVILSVIIFLIMSQAQAFSSLESEIYLNAYMRFTPNERRFIFEVPPELLQEFPTLGSELSKCGLSTSENSCLNSTFVSLKSLFSFKKVGEEGIRYFIKGVSENQYAPITMVLVTKVHSENKRIVVDSLEIFKTNLTSSPEIFTEFFNDYKDNKITPQLTLTNFSEDSLSVYLESAIDNEDSMALFHFAAQSLNLAKKQEELDQIVDLISKKLPIILAEKDSLYQREWIQLLINPKILRMEMVESVLFEYLKTGDELSKKMAAIELSLRNLRNDDVFKWLEISLKSERLADQLSALKGLFNIRNKVLEDAMIIEMMKNTHRDISKEAYNLIMKMELTDEHLEYVKSLFNTDDAVFRGLAVDILNKIKTDAGKNALLDLMVDNNPDVVKKAFDFVKLREINQEDINRFYTLIQNDREYTRFYSIYFINLDSSKKATETLYSVLDDKSDKVRQMSFETLSHRNFDELGVSSLISKVEEKRARFLVMKLLGLSKLDGVNGSIFSNLKKLSDDEQEAIFQLLKKKELGSGDYSEITSNLRTLKEKTRIILVKLLTKFPNKETLRFLEGKIRWERDKEVKKTMQTLIDHLKKTL